MGSKTLEANPCCSLCWIHRQDPTHPTDDYTETRGVWKPSPQHKLFRATAIREYCCHERLYVTNARMKDFPGEHYLKLHTASPSLLFPLMCILLPFTPRLNSNTAPRYPHDIVWSIIPWTKTVFCSFLSVHHHRSKANMWLKCRLSASVLKALRGFC